MPTEYTALVEALQNTNIPFKEYGWETRPDANFGVVSLDFEAGSLNGDGGKQDRATMAATVESVLAACCGDSWELNSIQHETETGLFHIEWVFRVTGTITAPAESGDD